MAMRLLQRSAVKIAKNLDTQREIEEGKKLAKRVDSLRELSSVEEKNLLAFRDQTMNTVRAELEPLHQEKRVLLQDIQRLETQRKLLLAPLDAKWEEVTKAQKIVDDWEAELTARESAAAHLEDDNKLRSATLKKRNAVIAEKEALVQEIVETATKMVADAKEVLADARNEAQTTKMRSELATLSLVERETAVALRERDAVIVKENNTKVRKENIQKSIQLADREATLERGFAELKRKQ